MENDVQVKFEDTAGVDEAKQELVEVIEFLKEPERLTSIGGQIPGGILFVGPPGTGKTLLAKAVAGESGVPFFSLSGIEFEVIYPARGFYLSYCIRLHPIKLYGYNLTPWQITTGRIKTQVSRSHFGLPRRRTNRQPVH